LDDTGGLARFAGLQGWAKAGPRGRLKDFAYRIAAHTGLWKLLASDFVFVIGKD
jgi:hypothetical protein